MAKSGLKFIERNAIIKALRSGLSWAEAKKQGAPNVDSAALDGFRKEIEAEVSRTAPAEKVTRVDPEEFKRLQAENTNLRRALDEKGDNFGDAEMEAALKDANAEIEKRGAFIIGLTKERDNLVGEVKKLQAEIESLILDDGKTKKK